MQSARSAMTTFRHREAAEVSVRRKTPSSCATAIPSSRTLLPIMDTDSYGFSLFVIRRMGARMYLNYSGTGTRRGADQGLDNPTISV
jgi:hypothetical protein